MNKELYNSLASATRYCQLVEQGLELIQDKQEEVKRIEIKHNEKMEKKRFPLWICLYLCFPLLTGIYELIELIVGYNDVIAALWLVLMVFGIVYPIIKLKKIKKEFIIIYQNETKPQMEKCLDEIEEIKEAMEKFGETNKHLLAFLPSKYRNLEATSYMLMVVSDGRAETLKEAMNLYEEQLHRWKMEDLAQKNAEIQEYMADALDELNARQAETNAHLSAIEQMEFIEYMHRQ